MRKIGLIGLSSVAAAGVLVLICAGALWAGGRAGMPDADRRLSEGAAAPELEDAHSGRVLHDDTLAAYLRTVTSRLWQFTGSTAAPLTVRILLTPELLAFTYPDGVCDLSTGMLALVRNEDQLAMLLAHEMVHYYRNHAGNRAFAAGNAVSLDEAEQQADREGLALMEAAGYCPSEISGFLSMSQSSAGLPPDPERLARFDRWLRTGGGPPVCGATEAASESFRKRIAHALLANARAALKMGWFDQAAESIDAYIRVRPADAGGYYILGEIRRGQKGPAGSALAMAAYRRALDLDSGFAPAYRALGVMYFKAGMKQEAGLYFERSLSLAPGDGETAYVREYLRRCTPPARN